MDEPFLPAIDDTNISSASASARPRRQFSSGYLDRRQTPETSTPRALRQSTLGNIHRGTSPLARVNSNSVLPFLASTTRVDSIDRRKLLLHQSTLKFLNHASDAAVIPNTPVITTPLDKDFIINFDRSNSAPPLFTEEKGHVQLDFLDHKHHSTVSPTILQLALVGLFFYVIAAVTVFTLTHDMFKGERTVKLVDALYFTVVTLSTIGYGDIIPASNFTKLFTCIFILVGFGFIDILLNGLVTYVLDVQEEILLDEAKMNNLIRNYVINKEKGRIRIKFKICLALGVVILCLTIGTLTVHYLEKLSWVDSFYLSVTSVTTVGYGDHAFNTAGGRCFAIIWLLASTLAVAKAFMYLTEYRLEKRNRRMAKDVLQKKATAGDLMGADMDHDGCISKSEYVIFKLKEMGKITESDVEEICKQFDSLQYSHHRRISITGLMDDDTDIQSEGPHHEASLNGTLNASQL